MLLDFLDLKRRCEGASIIPNKPSDLLFKRLKSVNSTAKTIAVKRPFFVFGFSLATAASVAILAVFLIKGTASKPDVTSLDQGLIQQKSFFKEQQIIFDSNNEQTLSAGVL